MPVIKNEEKLKWVFNFTEGFTLVELLMVILILGIIAAVVLPQFQDSSMDAKNSALQHNLSIVRKALELYAAQHDGGYPNAEDHNTFEKQLINYTNLNQQVTAAKSLEYPYGPYLKNKIPDLLPSGICPLILHHAAFVASAVFRLFPAEVSTRLLSLFQN